MDKTPTPKRDDDSITVEEWRAALDDCSVVEPPEPGWMTAHQIGLMIGRKKSATREHLIRLKDSGKVTMREFMVAKSNGFYQPVPHYKLKKP